ncbi:MAG: hypothetical protein D6731_06465 [Planctomycetota bacterium]|nr:MAG: hypothetical protein D6731_06465 [Planctomycetota bacterium]
MEGELRWIRRLDERLLDARWATRSCSRPPGPRARALWPLARRKRRGLLPPPSPEAAGPAASR